MPAYTAQLGVGYEIEKRYDKAQDEENESCVNCDKHLRIEFNAAI
jgi:hypothetical protein